MRRLIRVGPLRDSLPVLCHSFEHAGMELGGREWLGSWLLDVASMGLPCVNGCIVPALAYHQAILQSSIPGVLAPLPSSSLPVELLTSSITKPPEHHIPEYVEVASSNVNRLPLSNHGHTKPHADGPPKHSKAWSKYVSHVQSTLSRYYLSVCSLFEGANRYRNTGGILGASQIACSWIGVCSSEFNHGASGTSDDMKAGKSSGSKISNEIPQYVLDHAPLVHLYSDEQFWPCDIANHLVHTTPHLNFTPLQARSLHPKLENLNELNQWGNGQFVYLQSDDDVEQRPEWLSGRRNIPSDFDTGKLSDLQGDAAPSTDAMSPLMGLSEEEKRRNVSKGSPVKGGRSDAPATLIVVEKEDGIVDAFWFFFYSYNLGNLVFNIRFGNHIGDWEHTLVRFRHGVPQSVFYSEHYFGEAYSYDAVEKIGKRPVSYSATGTHAMYGTAGTHTYILPFGLLHDVTDRGPIWDPVLNSHMFKYDPATDHIRPSNFTPESPTAWFYFDGHWGDKSYPLSDPRQYQIAGQMHYVSGPLGPRWKNLGRKNICQGGGGQDCAVKSILENMPKHWDGIDEQPPQRDPA
ncbi:MAG: hypothetical protein M1825_003926 [Sarcosagium campestre]|nr:MAG: hypothetical protein M1825_003926 [Sarcosagium campestre]